MRRVVLFCALGLSLVSVAHAAPKKQAAAKKPAGTSMVEEWMARPIIDKLWYGNPQHVPTLHDATLLVGQASSTAAVTGQQDPFAVLTHVSPGMRPHLILALAHANRQGLEWVTRNLRPLLGLKDDGAK